MSFISQNKWIIAGVAILIAGGAWWGLAPSAPSPALTEANPEGVGADQSLIQPLLTLRAVKLEGTIFTDPAFMSLKDFSTQIIPEPVGRDNPFAPFPGQTAAAGGVTSGPAVPSAPRTKIPAPKER